MTTLEQPQPDTTTAAAADTDQALTMLARDSAEYLAGVIAAGMLESVGRPDKLPELMFPDVDPETVRRIWNAGLAAGYRAGKLVSRPQWTIEGLDRLRAALREAGHRSMAGLVDRTATAHPAPRAEDPEHGTAPELDPIARGGHQ